MKVLTVNYRNIYHSLILIEGMLFVCTINNSNNKRYLSTASTNNSLVSFIKTRSTLYEVNMKSVALLGHIRETECTIF